MKVGQFGPGEWPALWWPTASSPSQRPVSRGRSALVVCHTDDCGLARARVALERDALGVHRFVGLKIIQGAAGAPGPGAQGTPIVQLARLTFVDQPDDSLSQTRAVIRLNAAGVEDGIAPSLGQHLLLPGGSRGTTASAGAARTRACRQRSTRTTAAGPEATAPEFHNHRHRTAGAGRCGQRQLDVHADLRVGP